VCVWGGGVGTVVEVWSEKKPSDTRESGELRFYFYTSGLRRVPVSDPSHQFWATYIQNSLGVDECVLYLGSHIHKHIPN
jgi:hypothetical protein